MSSIKQMIYLKMLMHKNKKHLNAENYAGFTIVELLVVIVVIGILAAITIVSYIGVSQNAVAAGLKSDLSNASNQLKMFYIEKGTYPTINNCPSPGASEICLKTSNDNNLQYSVSNNLTPPTFNLTATNSSQTYAIGGNGSVTISGQNLLSGDTSIEKTGFNEFLQYADLAPIFNNYGLVSYTISFDIKSANIAVQSSIQAYMQNGSGARYSFNVSFPVTTSYVRKSITITPAVASLTLTQSMLAFYGIYGSGNIASVKNVKVELGSVATPWSQAP